MYSASTKKLTPVMEQYREAKEAYPDALLFFRLGDFYELFNNDAVVAARELELTLTSRNKGAPEPVPMAGVPYHAAHGYIARLVSKGFKVAICEQLGDPSKMKGLVPRKVVRVLTPGLLTDDGQLTTKRHNFLGAIAAHGESSSFGLALLDLSTGELLAMRAESPAVLLAELARSEPAELLVPRAHATLREAIALACPRTALRDDEPLDDANLRELLDERVAAKLYDDAVRDHPAEAVRAAASALRFARHHLPTAALPVRRIARHEAATHLEIDETAQAHLELVRTSDGSREGTLLQAIDVTMTAAGGRRLRRRLLAPLLEVGPIRRRLDAVEAMVCAAPLRLALRQALSRIGDLERMAVRAALGESTPRDLANLRDSLGAVPDAQAALAEMRGLERSAALSSAVDPLTALRSTLERALVDAPPVVARDGGVLREGWDAELDALRSAKASGTNVLVELESRLRTELRIPSLKVKYTRGFGFYIEVTKAHLDKIPSSFRRKQTLTGAERFASDELDAEADAVLGAEERAAEREEDLFGKLVEIVAREGERLRDLASTVAEWDVTACLAEVAHVNDYVRPDVDNGPAIVLEDARHAVVERTVPAGRFVPNDTRLDLDGERMLLVTGPNMAGKSTLMRQVALVCILAQLGSFVPARRARIGVVDRILSRVGASDNLARGESTFMVEMRETAAILRDATPRSLVILDEIGRGTSTFDGLAIAWAVTEHLFERIRCRALFATHYHELTALGDAHPGLANYSVSAREHDGSIVFLHRLASGAVNRSFGIAVARLAGLPEDVVARARAILASLEQGGEPAPGGPNVRHARLNLDGPDRGQLALFATSSTAHATAAEPSSDAPADASPEERAACARLRAADPNALTPLAALNLLSELRASLQKG